MSRITGFEKDDSTPHRPLNDLRNFHQERLFETLCGDHTENHEWIDFIISNTTQHNAVSLSDKSVRIISMVHPKTDIWVQYLQDNQSYVTLFWKRYLLMYVEWIAYPVFVDHHFEVLVSESWAPYHPVHQQTYNQFKRKRPRLPIEPITLMCSKKDNPTEPNLLKVFLKRDGKSIVRSPDGRTMTWISDWNLFKKFQIILWDEVSDVYESVFYLSRPNYLL